VPVLLPIHIVAAALGLIAGTIALASAKGRWLHRRSGTVFVYAMVAMCVSAVVAAIAKGQATNVLAGSLTAYLVLTGWMTVRPASSNARRWNIGLMLLAAALGTTAAAAGVGAIVSRSRTMFGYPPPPFILFGLLGLSGSAGDLRMIRSGSPKGARRLRRHLWRMCMALFIAAASFFSIRARVAAIFPTPMTTPLARTLPVLLVLAVMCYWLWRVRSAMGSGRWVQGSVQAEP